MGEIEAEGIEEEVEIKGETEMDKEGIRFHKIKMIFQLLTEKFQLIHSTYTLKVLLIRF